MLIVARVLQAVGAAMLQANSVALITEALPRRLLGRGIGIQGTAQALGLALGPAIGGLLLSLGGWRLIFLVNVPAGVIGFALGWFLLPRSRSRRPVHQADRLGAVQLALAVAGPLLYLSLAGRAGYANPLLVAALAAGLVAAVAFVRRERRVPDPLIDLSIFRRRTVSAGLSTGMVAYLVLFGTLVVVPYYLSAKHVGAALVGLQLAVLPVAIGVAAPIAGRLLNRIGARPLTGGGLLLTGAGLLEIALGHGTGGLVAGLALAGLGLGAFTPANNAAIMGASPKGHTGVVSGVLNMTRGIGTALGVALASAVYIAASGTGGTDSVAAAAANGLIASLAVLGALALAAGVALLVRPDTATPRCAITTNHASQGGQVMNESLDPATTHQIQRMVNDLCAEFAEEFTRAEIEEVMDDSVERIGETARFSDFLPLMAYRFTCERLKAITRARGEDVEGAWDVVFVSLSGGGRGQIAAALTAKLSGKRVSVHSAGTAARAEIDPQVRAVIEEIGLDPDEEFARPVTDEVLRGADVIVTMGHSVGVIEIPEGARHEDWRIGDPIGAPVDEIRRVRSDIEYRVRRLLTVLGAPGAEPAVAGPG
jgi:MFS family permease/protein-tyrosine-phosphatase